MDGFLLRCAGWPCFKILYMLRPILNCTVYLTESQWSGLVVG